jgi:hypothetical protein
LRTSITVTHDPPACRACENLQQAYSEVIASVRQSLGEAPLTQEISELLEQPPLPHEP